MGVRRWLLSFGILGLFPPRWFGDVRVVCFPAESLIWWSISAISSAVLVKALLMLNCSLRRGCVTSFNLKLWLLWHCTKNHDPFYIQTRIEYIRPELSEVESGSVLGDGSVINASVEHGSRRRSFPGVFIKPVHIYIMKKTTMKPFLKCCCRRFSSRIDAR